MPRRALVTGAAGFVGAVLARKLTAEGYDVHAVVSPARSEAALWRLEGLDLSTHVVDLVEEPAVRAVVARVRPEWVFHLAAHGAYSSQTDFRRMIESNILGTIHLVDACLRIGFEAFVHTGSSSEYGFTDHAPEESETGQPNSEYAVTKLTATLYCRAVAKREGVNLPTLRLYSVYGPFEEPSRFVPALAVHGMKRTLPPLVQGDVARDFVYVDDVVEALLLAATGKAAEPGAVYNVGTGRQMTIAEAVTVARHVLDIDQEPRFQSMSNRTWDTSCWVANPRKMGRALGWKARTDFETGFRRFVDWLREDPGRIAFYEKDYSFSARD